MSANNGEILKDFGDDLVMRRASPEDADRLASFNGRIHGDDEFDANAVATWTRDLLCRPHPTFRPEDFLLVLKKSSGEIVSSMNLISQTWMYEGISFGVGRPELVGTDPAYRGRGLVRAQFDVVHEWSRQRGEMVQAITGIPFFYRQFGYEMGLELGGGRSGYQPQVPTLEEGATEPYIIRPAAEADLPFLMKMYDMESRRSMIHCARDDALWSNELFGKSLANVNRWVVCVIETRDGLPVGYLVYPGMAWGTNQEVTRYMLDEGVSYLDVSPSVIRYLWQTGSVNAQARGRILSSFSFSFGSDHPAYHAVPERLVNKRDPYAYYVRVPDVPGFLGRIAPIIEKRLHGSVCAGHTGELKISFYRDGVRMVFERGKLTGVDAWKPKVKDDEGMAAFPNLSFLQLVFGYRSLDEIRYAYADCWADRPAASLLKAIFVKKSSSVWSVS